MGHVEVGYDEIEHILGDVPHRVRAVPSCRYGVASVLQRRFQQRAHVFLVVYDENTRHTSGHDREFLP
ncbi:hypothetical protein D3C83_192080 [compost metagenome]